ncbi:BatA and WFA domain-containing protein [Psychrobacillus sp. OK032]|uniref:vWA domain-containing protein n=1 Tax=Psychrobacillus sp. OK032 TaxID=1884358 RepID=UPI0008B9C47C|nr:BatA and WFA domain-containing protein [Psychrobacillus sp. OK032]SER61370.1 von Willebrand factor type A domain-containing protein [Psychrobacillus sp. OK032]
MGFNQLQFLWTAIFPIAVLLYYFFRKKYTKQPVSSTLFWQEVMRETKASPYLQHLQRNALFYLQMIAMILLVLALLQPFWKTKALAGEQIVFIVDTSATMEVQTNETTLFDTHKKQMLQLTESLSGKPLTIITTGNEPTVVVRAETNIDQIKSEIDKLEVSYEEENMSKSLDFAQSFFQQKATSVYIFTDVLDRQELPLQYENVTWHLEGLTSEVANLSIKRFGATKTNTGISVLIQLENQSNKEQITALSLANEQKNLLKEDVTIPPNETITLSFDELTESSFLKASLDAKDGYVLDNTMTVFMQDQLSTVFIDSGLHALVRTAFQSMDIDVSSVPTEQIGLLAEEGIVVTNQFGLLDQLDRPHLFIGRNDVNAVEVNGIVQTTEHALFSFANLSDIYVSSVYPEIQDYTTIATVGNHPFIQVSPRGDIVVLADIQMTDWPLHPSFPLFMWSVKEQLSAGNTYLGTFTPNERSPQSLGSTTNEWEIYTMEDSYQYSISNGGAFIAPKKPGLYVLRSNDVEKNFSVTLSQKEKEIGKGKTYKVSGEQIEMSENYSQHSFVPYILLVLLILFVIEWEVQRRRGFTS